MVRVWFKVIVRVMGKVCTRARASFLGLTLYLGLGIG
jgi:hypothetical protein